jgi:hypothetical protein
MVYIIQSYSFTKGTSTVSRHYTHRVSFTVYLSDLERRMRLNEIGSNLSGKCLHTEFNRICNFIGF